MTSKRAITKPISKNFLDPDFQEPISWVPTPYMKKAVKHLVSRPAAGLFLDPGMRKTSITLAAIKILKSKGFINKVLVLAPRRVCRLVWPAEVLKWKEFADLKIQVLHGKNKEEKLSEEADIYVVTFEGLEWLLGARLTARSKMFLNDEGEEVQKKLLSSVKVDRKRWKALGIDALVIDELTKFKNRKSNRTRLLREVLSSFKYRWGLTGSPAANGLHGLFYQMYVLDGGKSLGKHVGKFEDQYFYSAGWGGYSLELKEGAKEEIYNRIAPVVMRVAAEGNIELPEEVHNFIKVELPDAARAAYEEMDKELLVLMEEKVIRAANAGVRASKLRQIASGAIFYDEYNAEGLKKKRLRGDWVEMHTEKLKALDELISELNGTPLLVAYDFTHDMDRIRQAFGKDVPVMGTSDKKDKELEKAWNRGGIPFMFGHPMSIGHGLNLQGAGNHVAWFTLTYDYELYDQFNRRVRRSGNKHQSVIIHHIVARNTVEDCVIIPTLHRKEKTQNDFFSALQAYAAGRRMWLETPTQRPGRAGATPTQRAARRAASQRRKG